MTADTMIKRKKDRKTDDDHMSLISNVDNSHNVKTLLLYDLFCTQYFIKLLGILTYCNCL